VRKGLIIGACIALAGSCLPNVEAAETKGSGKADAESSVLIKASPRTVWKAIKLQRTQDPEIAFSRVLEDNGENSLLEQKFSNIPFLGSVTAVTKQHVQVNKHIDYSLVRSDKFKALEGAWDLTPVNGGRETMLNLRSHLDIGIPFSGMFIRATAQKKLNRRLGQVKEIAEREQARIAAGGAE
jgi:hypothetical protein